MTELISFTDLAQCDDVITVEELNANTLDAARRRGWSLRGVFSAELAVYGEPKKTLLGVFAILHDEVIRMANVRADEAVKDAGELRMRLYAAEKQVKDALSEMFVAKEALREMQTAPGEP